ncbi:hypothetical protein [Lacrimispora sp. JR3]
MDTINHATDEKKLTDVKVERIYVGEKTAKQLVLELLKKRRESGGQFS